MITIMIYEPRIDYPEPVYRVNPITPTAGKTFKELRDNRRDDNQLGNNLDIQA